jgi:hypothetical protein
MKVRVIASLVLALCLTASAASAIPSIGVFADMAATDCDATYTVPSFQNVFVLALLGAASAGGLIHVEFRVDGAPSAWSPTWIANPTAANSIGSPVSGGTNTFWVDCQTGGGNGIVHVGTIQFVVFSSINNVRLKVERHTTPSNPTFPCVSHFLCDAPVFTQICVDGGEMYINGPSICTVAVDDRSWSAIKSLYSK